MPLFKQLGICPVMVNPVLLDRNDRISFYHCQACEKSHMSNSCGQGNNMRTKHIGTRGLVCSSEALKVLPYVNEGLFGIDRIPSWAVFPVEVVVMLLLPLPLEFHAVDVIIVDHVETWTKITSNWWNKIKHNEIIAQCAEWGLLIPGSQVLTARSPPGVHIAFMRMSTSSGLRRDNFSMVS